MRHAGKLCVVRVAAHSGVAVPRDFFFLPSILFPLFVFFLLSRRVRVVDIQPAVKTKPKEERVFFRCGVTVSLAVLLPSQCSLFFLCDLCVDVCVFFLCVCVRVFLNSPCILLAAGAFIIRTCTVYCELSTRLSA